MKMARKRVLWARDTAYASGTSLDDDADGEDGPDGAGCPTEGPQPEGDEFFPDPSVDDALRENREDAASGSIVARAVARIKHRSDAEAGNVRTFGPPVILESQEPIVVAAEPIFDPRTHMRAFAPGGARTKLIEIGIEPGVPDKILVSSDRNNAAGMQEKWWRRMAEDSTQGWRRRLLATREHVFAIDELRPILPNFGSLLDIIGDALAASLNTSAAVRLPPTLLLGPPGVGKSFAADRIASALGEPCVSISMTTTTGINPLGGADAVWRNPRIGLVAEALIMHDSASPILFLDEVDKPFSAGSHDRPLDPLHTLLEPQTARTFKDELIELMFDASQITWLATANDLGPILPSILDRFLVLEVGAPAAHQMGAMIKLMVAQGMAAHHDWFEAVIDDAVIARLSALHPRRLRRVVEMACTAAAAAGERKLAEHHIQRAIRLIEAGVARPSMGFRI